MRSAPQAVLAVLATALILGFNPVAMKLLYALPAGMGPFQFIASRAAWCLVMYAVIAFAFRPSTPIHYSDRWKFALLGLCYGPGISGLLPVGGIANECHPHGPSVRAWPTVDSGTRRPALARGTTASQGYWNDVWCHRR